MPQSIPCTPKQTTHNKKHAPYRTPPKHCTSAGTVGGAPCVVFVPTRTTFYPPAQQERGTATPKSATQAPLFLCTGRLPPQRRFGAQPPGGRLLAHRCAFLFLQQGEKEMGGASPFPRKGKNLPRQGGTSLFLKGTPPSPPEGAQPPSHGRGKRKGPCAGEVKGRAFIRTSCFQQQPSYRSGYYIHCLRGLCMSHKS